MDLVGRGVGRGVGRDVDRVLVLVLVLVVMDLNDLDDNFRRLYASANPGWTRYVFDAVGRINHRHTRLRSLEMGSH